MLVRQLTSSERELKDGKPEYAVIDGSHRVVVCRETKTDIEWEVDIAKVFKINK